MDSKLNFINKSIDPVKNIEIDPVNFQKYGNFHPMTPTIVQALGFGMNQITVIIHAITCLRDVCFGMAYRIPGIIVGK